jgi:hypothetical protein
MSRTTPTAALRPRPHAVAHQCRPAQLRGSPHTLVCSALPLIPPSALVPGPLASLLHARRLRRPPTTHQSWLPSPAVCGYKQLPSLCLRPGNAPDHGPWTSGRRGPSHAGKSGCVAAWQHHWPVHRVTGPVPGPGTTATDAHAAHDQIPRRALGGASCPQVAHLHSARATSLRLTNAVSSLVPHSAPLVPCPTPIHSDPGTRRRTTSQHLPPLHPLSSPLPTTPPRLPGLPAPASDPLPRGNTAMHSQAPPITHLSQQLTRWVPSLPTCIAQLGNSAPSLRPPRRTSQCPTRQSLSPHLSSPRCGLSPTPPVSFALDERYPGTPRSSLP